MALAISTKRNGKLLYIIGLGLLTGTLDALAAIIAYWKVPAETIFRGIASGVFGKAAFSGGSEMIIYGVLFHYLIAFAFSAILFLLHPMYYSWFRTKFFTGVFYGAIIWTIMNLLVVPFSHAQPAHATIPGMLEAFGILTLCLGLPISYIATGFYFYKKG